MSSIDSSAPAASDHTRPSTATNRVMSRVRPTDPGHTETCRSSPPAYIAVRASGIQFSQQLSPPTRHPEGSVCTRSPWPSPGAHTSRSSWVGRSLRWAPTSPYRGSIVTSVANTLPRAAPAPRSVRPR